MTDLKTPPARPTVSSDAALAATGGLANLVGDAVLTLQKNLSEITLTPYLEVLNIEQWLVLFSLYGKPGLDQFNNLEKLDFPVDKAVAGLTRLISKVENSEQQNNILSKLVEYYNNYVNEKARLDELTKTAKDATKKKNDYRKAFNSRVATFTTELNNLVPDANKELLVQRQQKIDNAVAFEKRKKKREAGIIAILKGVQSAVIDNCDDDYIDVATTMMMEEAENTKEIVDRANKANETKPGIVPNPKSSEGTNMIFKAGRMNTETREKIQRGFAKNKKK